MRPLPRISVVVASHARPGWLARCLTSLRQIDYPSFEIVIAADTPSIERIERHPARAYVRTVQVDQPNISVARNAGVLQAGGDLVAFIDDDAVAEPTWLLHHARAFQTLDIAASVGFVRGRNGISYQSAVTSVDAEGETHREHAGDGGAFVPRLHKGRALKLVGTNAVVQRDILCELGGFDPAYRFYHDDTDLSLRLKLAGHRAGAVPLAQVHHAFAPSVRRTRLRAPRDLTEIGRSTAIFAHRYRGAPPDELKDRLFQRERARLIAHMVRGTCEPRDIERSLATLAEGWRAGAVLAPDLPAPIPCRASPFDPVPPLGGRHLVITSRLLGRRSAIAKARAAVKQGRSVTVISLSLTLLRHHVRFVQPGIWLQTGGQFGRSIRSAKRYRWCRFADRIKEEIRRVAMVRGIGEGAVSCDEAGERFRQDTRVQRGRGQAKETARKGNRETRDS